jgi:hypothetical protein
MVTPGRQLGSKRPLYLKKNKTTATDIGGWSSGQLSPLGRGGPTYEIPKMILELEFTKQANGRFSRYTKKQTLDLVHGSTPSKIEIKNGR